MGRAFSGFPSGALAATLLPSLFFVEPLGEINDLAELKVTLYLFWRLGQKKGSPRYVTRRELEADPTIRAGLKEISDGLPRGLAAATERGTVLRRTMELRGAVEECYFLNTESGRQAVADLEAGRLDLGQVMVPEAAAPARAERPNIFQLYEQNLGLLTPLIVEQLAEAERTYPGEWIEDAFRQAAAYNRRNWRYVQRILERWASEGKDDETTGRGHDRTSGARANRADARRSSR
ncbi:MAG TPA: DnaD domain protein [Chloroflexota bacterium]|nr:DnaD domain protein [Chloroflexota bacterium]